MTQPNAITFGDLVKVSGYGNTPFFVDSWQEIRVHEPEGTYTEVVYDITNAFTGEYELAYAEDITRICGAEAADDYLMYHASPSTTTPNKPKEVSGMMYGRGKPERKPTARELSAQEAERRKQARKDKSEKIDALLDEYGDYRRLADEFGDEEYRAMVEYIGVKLAEISAE